MRKPAKRSPPRTEKEQVERALERVIADIGDLERKWSRLPEDVRRKNPDLARWFGEKPAKTEEGH